MTWQMAHYAGRQHLFTPTNDWNTFLPRQHSDIPPGCRLQF